MKQYVIPFACLREFLIIFFSVFATNALFSQEFKCGMRDFIEYSGQRFQSSSCIPDNDASNHSVCYNPEAYIPSLSYSNIPIRINLIFVQRSDGTGNYQQDNEDQQIFLDEAIEQLNYKYAHLRQDENTPHCYVGTSFINDAKIRFEDSRYYIRDDYGWNSNVLHGFDCSLSSWYLSYLDNQIRQCDSIPDGINIFFTENAEHYYKYEHGLTVQYLGGDAVSRFPNFSDMNFSSRIHMPEYYSMYWCKVFLQNPNVNDSIHALLRTQYAGWLAKALAHELGHSLNLYHPNNNNYDPYETCHNSIMMQAGAGERDFLSPYKIGRIHYALMGSNLQNYVPEDAYCGTKLIWMDVSFPRMRFYHSLSIRADVTMNCEAIMPEQATIYLREGGNLYINGGDLHSITNKWNGIVVKDGCTLVLSNTSIADYNIVIEDGGTLIVEGNISLSGDNNIKVMSGGCFCVDEHAAITLADPFSIIELYPNALLGCGNLTNSHCVEAINDIMIFGQGKICTYDHIGYVQNEIISIDTLVTGSSVRVGYNVTNAKPVGSVIVTSDGNLRIQSTEEVVLTRDVEIQLGGELEIQ